MIAHLDSKKHMVPDIGMHIKAIIIPNTDLYRKKSHWVPRLPEWRSALHIYYIKHIRHHISHDEAELFSRKENVDFISFFLWIFVGILLILFIQAAMFMTKADEKPFGYDALNESPS